MKRIYEFRGKAKTSKLCIYGSLVLHKDKAYVVRGALMGGLVEVIPESIGQLIGRRDKNKKEIYAGDIVKWVNNFGERIIGWVRYTHFIAGFSVILIKGGRVTFYEGDKRNFSWSSLRIVGNRIENPEMIEYEYWQDKSEKTEKDRKKKKEFLQKFN